ncbi:MetQ/NlpA family ABC transporter substrate-binding protein [Sporosarcina sp. Marseille-Q4943]|uniref:MetQ/NlpA family ABC transporter substrate-binding protein n=1 Tax=Sporosarcina sp. Marseille-Q4943 TaxID=2942204 RepID=UPI00208DCB3D|nr:MetQ/NlpA family ABC transporter substrate-binding protein [Sporosarcina sp. Marseille-Q4943]
MKNIIKSLGILLLLTILAACGKGGSANDDVVVIGVTGSDGEQWNVLKELAKEEGITIELKEFADYTLPNNALANGDIDLNSFQHIAFLSQFAKENNLDIVPIGSTVIAPLGIYSNKLDDISGIKEGDKIAVPDDPSNLGRALRLLETAGLIKLKEGTGLFGDTTSIEENPKNLEIIPMVAQQTPRVLQDVAASLINNGIAGQAGFNPIEDPIFLEDGDSENALPYVNVFAARAEDAQNETYLKIVELYQSEQVKKAIEEETKGGSILLDISQDELLNTFEQLKGEE